MNIVYAVFAHKNPSQVARLIRRVRVGSSRVFLHVDAKAPLEPFLNALGEPEADEHLCVVEDRVRVTWGGFSLVQAILNTMKSVAESRVDFDHLLLLSGQCYPIKPQAYVKEFLRSRSGQQIISALHIPNDWPSARKRIEKYHLMDLRVPWTMRALRLLNRVLPPRRFPRRMTPYGGSMYFAITPDCLRYLVERAATDRKYRGFFKLTKNPDELFFHTLIMNSPYRDTVFNWNPWFIDWLPRSSHPRILDDSDFRALSGSDKLFARKFELPESTGLLDRLDKLL